LSRSSASACSTTSARAVSSSTAHLRAELPPQGFGQRRRGSKPVSAMLRNGQRRRLAQSEAAAAQ
jgi:hypothetical protein